MRYVVFGAGGFIGSYLTKRLKGMNHYVIGIDRHVPRFMDSYADEFHICEDVGNEINIQCGQIDGVFQLCAYLGGSTIIDHGTQDADIFTNNMRINISVLNFCKKNSIQRIFFASSVCVYGGNNKQLDPVNIYGWEKLAAEKLYTAFAKQYNACVSIGRLYNIYGPNQEFKGGRERVMSALAYRICTTADNTLTLSGNSYNERSFLHVEDCVDAIIRLIHSDINVPVDIGSNKSYNILEVARMMVQHSGKQIQIHYNGDEHTKSVRLCNPEVLTTIGWNESFDIFEGTRQIYDFVYAASNSSNGKLC